MNNKTRNAYALSMGACEWIKYARRVCQHRKHLLPGAALEYAALHNEMYWQVGGGRTRQQIEDKGETL